MFDHFVDPELRRLLQKEDDHRVHLREAYSNWQTNIAKDATEQIIEAAKKYDDLMIHFAIKEIVDGLIQAVEYATEKVPYKSR